MAIAVYYHPLFLRHDTGTHPESSARLVAAREALMSSGLEFEWLTPEPAPVEAVARVHDRHYIESVRRIAAAGGAWLDMDTAISPASYDAAILAAGAGIDAVDGALDDGRVAFMLVRPPGHHACRTRGMGFCLFNNIAVAAAYALAERGLERVLIVDWDVHHGNGTQQAFYDDPRVLFFSTHQANHYPGTGLPREVGAGPGAGYTVNIALAPGTGDGAVLDSFRRVLLPLAEHYQPQLLLVSSGYDAQDGDPLGDLGFSGDAYGWMAHQLRGITERSGAAGPLFFLEGGYDPEMEAASIVTTLRGLEEDGVDLRASISARVREAVQETVMRLEPFWGDVLSTKPS